MLKNNKRVALLTLIAILGFLGFLDATFLTIKHFQGTLPPCSLALGCEKVLNSQYATVNGIPIALLGSIFYLTMMVLSIVLIQTYIPTSNFPLQKILILLVFSGFFVSVILFLIQAFVLHSFCQYCLASEAITTLLLILSVVLTRLKSTI